MFHHARGKRGRDGAGDHHWCCASRDDWGGIPSGDGQKPDDTMKQKLENFSVSYIEAIAAKRNRNVEWAKSATAFSSSGEPTIDLG